MPGEVIKKENGTEATHFIPRFSSSLLLVKGFLYHSILFFWPKFFLEKSFSLSAEGELLVDKAWPGVLRDGKVGRPETNNDVSDGRNGRNAVGIMTEK